MFPKFQNYFEEDEITPIITPIIIWTQQVYRKEAFIIYYM